MPDLDAALREYFEQVAPPIDTTALPGAAHPPPVPRRPRFGPLIAVAAAAVVTVAVGLSVVLFDDAADPPVATAPVTVPELTLPAPVADGWEALLPGDPRASHAAVWTGDQMIVWGGVASVAPRAPGLLTGARYDPAVPSWAPIAPAPLAAGRGMTAVWTGDEMIVWGGAEVRGDVAVGSAAGAAYDPAADAWRPLAQAPLSPRWQHRAVWTGSEMIVLGGFATGEPAGFVADGAAYDPATDTWRLLAPTPFSHPPALPLVAWDGTRVLVWAGELANPEDPAGGEGAAYDPATDTWYAIAPAPLEPGPYAGAWTGSELLAVGGYGTGEGTDLQAAAYDPATGEWRALPTPPGGVRFNFTATWTGTELLVVGGDRADWLDPVDQDAAYDPMADAWRAVPDLPAARPAGHTAVWSGNRLIVWGGYSGAVADEPPALGEGAAYRPG